MTTQKLLLSVDLPDNVKNIFKKAPTPYRTEENLWRDVAARVILDAMGFTGLTGEPTKHNKAVREARMWFKFDDENVQMVFDLAGLELYTIKETIVNWEPRYFEEKR
jgi:hypothetical protein